MNSVALIVTYNRLTKLKKCLQATLSLSFNHIVIVNNASSDGTTKWLTTQTDPRLHIINSNSNLGGAGGFKRGAQYINTQIKTDWVFFFDDDAYPSANILDQFYHLDKQNYQLFCSKVILPSGELCKMNIPYKKIPHSIYESIQYVITPKKFLPNFQRSEQVETFSFVGAILHQNILKRYADKIDEKLFIYFDDILFSHYLTQSNYPILFVPQLIFTHDTDSNNNLYQSNKIYYLVRNLVYLRKTQPAPFSKTTIFLKILYILFLSIIKTKNISALPLIIKGIKDSFYI